MADMQTPFIPPSWEQYDSDAKVGRWDRLSKPVDATLSEQIYRKTDYHQSVEQEALARCAGMYSKDISFSKASKGK